MAAQRGKVLASPCSDEIVLPGLSSRRSKTSFNGMPRFATMRSGL